MKAILGRLSDLGVRELFRLLTSASASGQLEIECAGERVGLEVRGGYVSGRPTPTLAHALVTRSGTFCFRAAPVAEGGDWLGLEEFLARVDALAEETSAALARSGAEPPDGLGGDFLEELRHSLAEVPLPGVGPRLLVITADPRPYRALEPEWRQRGWEVSLEQKLEWVAGYSPTLVVVHLPTSATLAGQGELWLGIVRRAARETPPVPVIWVGGLTDPWLRHHAIAAGAEYLLPAPAGEVGEAARWFREDLTAVVERALSRRESGVQREAAAFRDFFLALHADAAPADVHASLLRFAATFFARGLLLAVRDAGFDSLGGFGFPAGTPGRLPRGAEALERVVIERRPVAGHDLPAVESRPLAAALGSDGDGSDIEVFPLLRGGECVALLVGHRRLPEVLETASLASLLARSGSLL